MDMYVPADLRDRRILIIEPETRFQHQLRDALEREGAETVVVSDPFSPAGAACIARFEVCAAAVNTTHRAVGRTLRGVPTLIYGVTAEVPADIQAITGALKVLLIG